MPALQGYRLQIQKYVASALRVNVSQSWENAGHLRNEQARSVISFI
jgi:hypothetical protein